MALENDDRPQRAAQLRRQGMSIRQVAHELASSPQTVWRMLDAVERGEVYRGYRSRSMMAELKAGIHSALEERRMTVRHLFYVLTTRKLLTKCEADCDRLSRLCVEMREGGELDWDRIYDENRDPVRLETYPSVAAAIARVTDTYHRPMWEGQPERVMLFAEKAGLADLLWEVTSDYDVTIYPTGGLSSVTFIYRAAGDIAAWDSEYYRKHGEHLTCYAYQVGDDDPTGEVIFRQVEYKLPWYTRDKRKCRAQVNVTRLALTPQQVEEYDLSDKSRETKQSTHSKGFNRDSTEIEALPVEYLQEMVREAIVKHIDQRIWDRVERQQGRDLAQLRKLAKGGNG